MINILLTGSTGHIGKQIKKLLLRDNHKLFLPVRDLTKFNSNQQEQYFEFNLLKKNHSDFFSEVEYVIHAATCWDERSVVGNVDGFKHILDSLNPEKIKRVIILSSASVVKKKKINPDALKFGFPYIQSKYLQFKMVESHPLKSKCNFLFLTLVADHQSILNVFTYIYNYKHLLPNQLPENKLHMMHSEDIAQVAVSMLNSSQLDFINIGGLPQTDIATFFKINKINFTGRLPFPLLKILANRFIDTWGRYNLNHMLDQSFPVINPSNFNKNIKYNYNNIIHKPDISILICSYNRLDSLKRSINYLRNQEKNHYSNLEIIVINHSSDDGTYEWLAEQTDIKSFDQPRTSSLSEIRNTSFEKSSNEYIIFLDDDIVVKPNFLDNHVKNYRFNPKANKYYVGGLSYIDDVKKIKNQMGLHSSHFPTGNSSASRRHLEKIIKQDGFLFDPIFNKYGWEDVDLGIRFKKNGIKRQFVKNAVGFHLPQTKQISKRNMSRSEKEKCRAEMGYVLYQKHKSFAIKLTVQHSIISTIYCFILSLGGLLNKRSIQVFKPISFIYKFLEETIVYGCVNQNNLIRKIAKKKK